MLFRRYTTVSLAILSTLLVATTSAQESSSSHLLRVGNEKKRATGPKGAKTVTTSDDDHKKCPKKGMISVEKGGMCIGGFDAKAMKKGKKCKGGLKMDFMAGTGGEEVVTTMAKAMASHVADSFVPDVESFLPDDDTMEKLLIAMQDGQDSEASITEDGMDTMKFEFGGFAKMGWGCKVFVTKKKEKLRKKAFCGVFGMEGMGAKPKGFYDAEFTIDDDWEEDDDKHELAAFEIDMADLEWE